MQIYRLGTRMAMVIKTDDAVYDPERLRIATETDPVIQRWEALMWRFQAPTPWTPAGQKAGARRRHRRAGVREPVLPRRRRRPRRRRAAAEGHAGGRRIAA